MKIRRINSSKDFVEISKCYATNTEKSKELLRQLRENECFKVINRGELWYNLLTDAQKEELKLWYQQWLDVTETCIIPIKPYWL